MSTTAAVHRQTETAARHHGVPAPGRSARMAPPAGATSPPGPQPAGRFRGDLGTDRWWWSPELYTLHGLAAGSARPTIGLLLDHVLDADRPRVREALSSAATAGTPTAREYRLLRPDGTQRAVLLVCEPECDGTGAVTTLGGLVVDVTGARGAVPAEDVVRHLETEVEQLRTAMASRAAIEQAKGILMLLTSCGDQVAFELLAHISSHTHRKVRDVAVSIIESASGQRPLPDDVREILHDACPPGRATV